MVRVYHGGTEETKHEPPISYWEIVIDDSVIKTSGDSKEPVFSDQPNFKNFMYKNNIFKVALPDNLEPGESIICKAPITQIINTKDIIEIRS